MKIILKNHNIIVIRIILLLSFIIFPRFLYSFTETQKIDFLVNSKQTIQNECEANDKTEYVLFMIDSLANVKRISESNFIGAIGKISEIFRHQGKLIAAIEFYLNLVSQYNQIENISLEQVRSLINFYIPLGASHEEIGMWNRAMEFYLEALSLAEENNFDDLKAMIYNNIGAIYFNRAELDKAEFYMLKAKDINIVFNNKSELFNNYNNLAEINSSRGNYDLALDYALQAIQQLDNEKDAYLYYFMQSNIANIYMFKKDYKLALSYLENAMRNQEKHQFVSDLVQTYLFLSRVYEFTQMKDSAQKYMHKSLQQADILNNKHIESQIQHEAADYYKRSGDFEKAYNYLITASSISDSISIVDSQQKMSDLERVYADEKKMRENELLVKNITIQKLASDRLWIITASFSLLLIIIVLYLIYHSRNKEKERKNEELLLQQQKELHEIEKEIQKQKEQDLNDAIDKQNRELTSYTLHTIKTNEFITDLLDELKKLLLELNPRNLQNKEHIKQIINKLNYQSATDNWDEFKHYFEKVHPLFYNDLERNYPNLTIKEKRLCAFLRLGLSSKEISYITFKEVRSVESARNRLRKKLDINPEDSLTDFICNIS